MSAILSNLSAAPKHTPRVIGHDELPAFTSLPASAADDERLTFLFRATLKLGRIHPLYLPMLKYRNARHGHG